MFVLNEAAFSPNMKKAMHKVLFTLTVCRGIFFKAISNE
jgi:hypothetical protein